MLHNTIYSPVKVRLLRNATLLIEMAGKRLLIDPMLSDKGTLPTMPMTSNGITNPTTPLPVSVAELEVLLSRLDAVLVTHLHPDHWDQAAANKLNKFIPVLCQPSDISQIKQAGFFQVLPVIDDMYWDGINIVRTRGRHGHGELAEKMAPVSGFMLEANSQRIYIAGDTVWCPEVKETLIRFQPDIVVLNAGAARFDHGEPITMTAEEILEIARFVPEAKIVVAHMEALNHCNLSRTELKEVLSRHHLLEQCVVPEDGEEVIFNQEVGHKSRNRRIVEQLYRLFKIRDLEGLKMMFSEEIIWQQMEGFPGGGTYVGPEAVFSGVFNRFSEEWTGWKAVVEEFLDAGDTILVSGYYEGTYKTTRRHVVAKFAHLYTLQKAKIVRFQQYSDTALIAEAMGMMEQENILSL